MLERQAASMWYWCSLFVFKSWRSIPY